MNESTVRCFLAAPMPVSIEDSVQNALVTARAQQSLGPVRWVAPRNWHLTLAFLGDRSASWISTLQQALGSRPPAVTGSLPILLRGRRISGFPDAKSRIVALEFDDSSTLVQLKQQLDQVLQALGWQSDQPSFRPHVTLGRAGRDRRLHLRPVACEVEWPVTQVTLYQSTLKPGGSEYQALWSVPVIGT
ncbi:MAG: RNA 2',3'-cyclic phosphodiesterase [Gammaproteobacteria bacterium]